MKSHNPLALQAVINSTTGDGNCSKTHVRHHSYFIARTNFLFNLNEQSFYVLVFFAFMYYFVNIIVEVQHLQRLKI